MNKTLIYDVEVVIWPFLAATEIVCAVLDCDALVVDGLAIVDEIYYAVWPNSSPVAMGIYEENDFVLAIDFVVSVFDFFLAIVLSVVAPI